MKGLINTQILVLTVAAAVISGCTKSNDGAKLAGPQVGSDLFSNRPIASAPDLTVVTFSEPPLLAVSVKTKHGWNVPASAKRKLLAQHADFEAKLKSLAPDAKIIYRYHMTLNAMAIFTAADLTNQLQAIAGVKTVSAARQMARPEALNIAQAAPPAAGGPPAAVNSVNFIGSEAAHKLGYTGKGMRIGILDTGIDYTHAMLGGSGKKDDFTANNPALPNAAFPNSKVVGGIDLVGTNFNSASPDHAAHQPIPDANPIDEAGHGSHVAGTIAGHGNGLTTYDGVAPDAQLYAIKVFGKEGSTADAVVIAGFEFAADPNGDLNPDDQLDVINMSLGGAFGQPQILYTEAIRNLSRAGTVVVAAAGNAGPIDYIVGAPSTSDDALSVAASIDGAPVNWKFATALFSSATQPALLVKEVEGPVSKPIADSAGIRGPLVDIGDASTDLTPDQKAELAGKVALIVRGTVSFAVKLQRAADAGAIGVVVYNNAPADPIPMGGDPHVDIPAFMVSQALGLQLIEQMKTGPVSVQFKTDQTIDEPQNIDTITSFSSKGPRSEDNLIKPEVSAPGQNITSAGMGTGNLGVKMDGTSMATPHMVGAIALIKQAHPDLSSDEIKSLAMNTSKLLNNKDGLIPTTMQGAGRIQIDAAIQAEVVSETSSLSLGRVQLQQVNIILRQFAIRNLTGSDLTLNTAVDSTPGMKIDVPATVHLAPHAKTMVTAKFTFTQSNANRFFFELDGRIFFKEGSKTVLQIPAMAIRTEASQLSATGTVGSSLVIKNASPNSGIALPFNLIGEDKPKAVPGPALAWQSRSCDLQSVGYRIVEADTANGKIDVIQFAFKLFTPVTTWHLCSISVLIDSDGDGIADQELAGVTGSGLEGVAQAAFASVLLDAAKARDIRLAYEKDLSAGKVSPLSYAKAVIGIAPMAAFDQSTVAVIQAPVSALALGKDGMLNIRMAAQAEGGETIEADKFLGPGTGTSSKISPDIKAQGFYGMEEVVDVAAGGAPVDVIKGNGTEKLVLYYPLNEFKVHGEDAQEQIIH